MNEKASSGNEIGGYDLPRISGRWANREFSTKYTPAGMRVCPTCKVRQARAAFVRDARKRDGGGVHRSCVTCRARFVVQHTSKEARAKRAATVRARRARMREARKLLEELRAATGTATDTGVNTELTEI